MKTWLESMENGKITEGGRLRGRSSHILTSLKELRMDTVQATNLSQPCLADCQIKQRFINNFISPINFPNVECTLSLKDI